MAKNKVFARQSITNKLRRSLFVLEYKISCGYCEKILKAKEFSIDHMVPLSRGGTNQHENLAICCKICNALKKNMTVAEFLVEYSDKKQPANLVFTCQSLKIGQPKERFTTSTRKQKSKKCNNHNCGNKAPAGKEYCTPCQKINKVKISKKCCGNTGCKNLTKQNKLLCGKCEHDLLAEKEQNESQRQDLAIGIENRATETVVATLPQTSV